MPPLRPVCMQSKTSASSCRSTVRMIKPVKSVYMISFNWAICAAFAASALPAMAFRATGPLPSAVEP